MAKQEMKMVYFAFPVKNYETVMRELADIIGLKQYENRRHLDGWKEWSGEGNSANMYYVNVPVTEAEYAKVASHPNFAFYILVTIPLSLLQYYNTESKQNPHYSSDFKIAEQEEVLERILANVEGLEQVDVEVTLSQHTFSNFALSY